MHLFYQWHEQLPSQCRLQRADILYLNANARTPFDTPKAFTLGIRKPKLNFFFFSFLFFKLFSYMIYSVRFDSILPNRTLLFLFNILFGHIKTIDSCLGISTALCSFFCFSFFFYSIESRYVKTVMYQQQKKKKKICNVWHVNDNNNTANINSVFYIHIFFFRYCNARLCIFFLYLQIASSSLHI